MREFPERPRPKKGLRAMARCLLVDLPMYLREALRRCQDLEQRAATLYEARAAAETSGDSSEIWKQRAETETRHARILADLLRDQERAEDDGPFVIDLRGQITRLREALDEAFATQKCPEGIRTPSLYSTDFVLQCCDSLFERIVRIAELSVEKTAAR